MSIQRKKLARRLARMSFDLEWAKGAAHAAHGWVQAGETDSPKFHFCFREALDGARKAVREGEAIERILYSEGKADA